MLREKNPDQRELINFGPSKIKKGQEFDLAWNFVR